jgi:hypothetical protein
VVPSRRLPLVLLRRLVVELLRRLVVALLHRLVVALLHSLAAVPLRKFIQPNAKALHSNNMAEAVELLRLPRCLVSVAVKAFYTQVFPQRCRSSLVAVEVQTVVTRHRRGKHSLRRQKMEASRCPEE